MTVKEFTPAEVGVMLRMDQNKVTRLIRYGELKARRKYKGSGKYGHYLITEQAVDDYRRSCST